jgi:hypothetical protein
MRKAFPLAFSLVAIGCGQALATSYYVSPAGSDTNPGTSTAPWQTIAKVNQASFFAGDQLYIDGSLGPLQGCLSLAWPNVQSSAANPFVVQPWNAPTAEIDSTCGGNGLAAALRIAGVSGVTVQDIVLRNAAGSPATIWGAWITGPGNGITLTGMDIGGFNTTSTTNFAAEVLVDGTAGALNGITVSQSSLHGVNGVSSTDDAGIGGYGAGQNISNVLYTGNTVYNIGGRPGPVGASGAVGNGILLNGTVNAVVSQNVAHDLGANNTSCGGPGGIWAYNSSNFDIIHNEVYNVRPVPYPTTANACDWNAFDADGYTTNGIIEANYSHDNFGAGYLMYPSGTWGPNTFRNNLSSNDGMEGNLQWGIYGAIVWSGWGQSPGPKVAYIYNNSVYNALAPKAQYGWGPSCFVVAGNAPTGGAFNNNICSLAKGPANAAAFYSFTDAALPIGMTFDYNDLFLNQGGGGFGVVDYAGQNFGSLAAWQNATGNDRHSITANPLFTGPNPDAICGGWSTTCPSAAKLQHGSPAVGIGLDINAVGFPLQTSVDYFNDPIPNALNTGYNIGADGAAR